MPINTREILSLVTRVCEEENLQVSIKGSLKGGAIAGLSATIGGLLGGPIGIGIGGTIGSLGAAYMAQGTFKSVADVIRYDLTPGQKEKLCSSIKRILDDIGPEDILAISAFALQPTIKERMLQEVFYFFQSQLQMKILD